VGRLNVLITAASRRVALVRGFQRALLRPNTTGKVIVTDINPLSPAVHIADRAYRVPLSSDPGYLDEIRAICESQDIRLIVPTIDDEVPLFAAARADFEAAGIRVAVPSPRTAEVCVDKYATSRRLRMAGVAVADTWLPAKLPVDPVFPLFIKPRDGRGGVQAFAVRNPEELRFFLGYVHNPVVQTYLDGPEFTLDLLCDFEGRPLSVVPRERVVIRSGVIDRGRTVNDPALISLALTCAKVFQFAGAVNIQCRVVQGVPTVFEINPRFAGGIPLTLAAGADFPGMLVDLALNRPVSPSIGAFKAELWMSSFETSIFLDQPAEALQPCPPRPLSQLAAAEVA
jgi:carbamoyl-phosphate synthase large subunit